MIRAYCGLLGAGKTLRMVMYCMEAMKKGRTVISNVKIEFEYKGHKYKSIYCGNAGDFEHKILTARNAVVAIDEAGSIFSSAQWNKLSFEMTYRFRVNRKMRCDLVFTAQDFYDVVKPLRKLTDDVVLCYKSRWFGFGRLPRLKKGKIVWDVQSLIFHYSYAKKEGFTQAGTKRRNFYEFVKKRESYYPCHYLAVQKAYDTMDIPDPYVMVKNRSGIYTKKAQERTREIAKQDQIATSRSAPSLGTPQSEPTRREPTEKELDLIERASQTIAYADK